MKHRFLTPLCVTLSLVTSTHAAIISWSADNAGTIGGSGTAQNADDIQPGSVGGQTGPNDFAGFQGDSDNPSVRADYWGNSWNGGSQVFSPQNLIDNQGNLTTLDVTTSDGNDGDFIGSANVLGNPGIDADGDWNRNMLTGYINTENPDIGVEIQLSEIPYARYDIYVYFMSDVDSRVGSVTASDATNVVTSTYYFGANPGSVRDNDPAAFNLANDQTIAGYAVDANYARFRGLTGDTQFLTTIFFTDASETQTSFGGIAGFQIVEVPEPSIALLGGLAAAGMLRRRRF